MPRLIAAVSGFSLGILAESFGAYAWPVAAFLVVLAAICIGANRLQPRAVYLIVGIFFLSGAFGMARMLIAPATLPSVFSQFVGHKVELEGTVADDPDVRDSNQRVPVEIREGSEKTKILAVAPLYPKLAFGEQVRVFGNLKSPEPFETDGGRVFRYDDFLAKDGIFAIISYASIETVSPPAGFFTQVQGFLFSVKHAFIRALSFSLPEPFAGLGAGLIAGGKQGLDQHTLDAFTVAGLLPIVVLSGYNVMIVADGVRRGLFFFGKGAQAGIAGLVVLAFVLSAGGGASAIRAGLMAGLALFARGTGRTYDALRALSIVFVGMLLINPLLLANDPGFQFSFVATLGLILATPLIEPKLAFIQSGFLREIIATTVAAQLFVLPLLLYQTGNLSLVSIFANALALPLVPLAMLTSFIAGVAGLLIPAFAAPIAFPAFLLLSYLIGVARIAASLPLSHLIIPAFPFWIVVALYVALGCLVARELMRQPSSSGPRRTSNSHS